MSFCTAYFEMKFWIRWLGKAIIEKSNFKIIFENKFSLKKHKTFWQFKLQIT